MTETWSQPPPSGPPAGGRFAIMVAYSNGAESKPTTVVRQLGPTFPDLASALAEAERQAFVFDPPDPWSPQGRSVYRVNEREFLVLVPGITATYPFAVQVVEEVSAPPVPNPRTLR